MVGSGRIVAAAGRASTSPGAYPLRVRGPALLVLLLTALVAGACGDVGDGPHAAVEESIADRLGVVLGEEAPLVELRSVDCAGARPTLECRVRLDVRDAVVEADYTVAVAADGCWSAARTRVAVVGAGAEIDALRDAGGTRELTGCSG